MSFFRLTGRFQQILAQFNPLAISLPSCYELLETFPYNPRVGKTENRETFGPIWRFLVENGFLGVREVMR